MKIELRPLGSRWREGTLGGRRAVATITGMGTRLAAEATEALLDAYPDVERVVVTGIAGAVDAETAIGRLIVPKEVIDYYTGTAYEPEAIGGHTAEGKIVTSDELLTAQDLLTKFRADGVVALDMESASVAAVCARRGVPCSVFRSISDRATDDVLDPEVFSLANEDGSPRAGAGAKYLLRHPGKIPALMGMARGATLAAKTAAEAALAALR
jgi:nucleoside phosphorylase